MTRNPIYKYNTYFEKLCFGSDSTCKTDAFQLYLVISYRRSLRSNMIVGEMCRGLKKMLSLNMNMIRLQSTSIPIERGTFVWRK